MTRNRLINSYIVLRPVIILALSLSVLGCDNNSDKQSTLPAATSAASQQQIAKPVFKAVSSTLKITPAPVNQFDFSSKKDPFKPVVKAEAPPTKESLERSAKAALPIHSFDVSQFKLIGIVIGGKENFAQVTDPNGKGYVLKKGMAIGKNDGKVMSISKSGVEILEQFKDDNDKVRKENIILTLPKKP